MQKILFRKAFVAVLTTAIASVSIQMQAGKGGNKGGKGNFENVFFDVAVAEFDQNGDLASPDDHVFWGDLCGSVGVIQDDYPDDGIVMSGVSTSTGQPVNLGNLLAYVDPSITIDVTELETCFPGITGPGFTALGAASLKRDDDASTPGVEEVTLSKAVNGAYNKSGKQLWYRLYVRGLPTSADGLWTPLTLENPGDTTTLVLTEWLLEAGTGNPNRGCQLYGTFNESIVVSIVRRSGPLADGECGN